MRYINKDCVVFFKTKDKWGELSNMCGGFPIVVNGVTWKTSEALYQAMKFPNHPEAQREILIEKSPMTAKWVAKKWEKVVSDENPNAAKAWDSLRVGIMKWVVNIKIDQHWSTFHDLFEEIGERPIVELSRKDSFWGAIPIDGGDILEGSNQLGRIWTDLKDYGPKGDNFEYIRSLKLLGEQIRP